MLMSTFVTNICSAAIGTSENSNFASDVLIRFVSNHGSVIGYDLFITVNAISSRWNQKKTRRDRQKKSIRQNISSTHKHTIPGEEFGFSKKTAHNLSFRQHLTVYSIQKHTLAIHVSIRWLLLTNCSKTQHPHKVAWTFVSCLMPRVNRIVFPTTNSSTSGERMIAVASYHRQERKNDDDDEIKWINQNKERKKTRCDKKSRALVLNYEKNAATQIWFWGQSSLSALTRFLQLSSQIKCVRCVWASECVCMFFLHDFRFLSLFLIELLLIFLFGCYFFYRGAMNTPYELHSTIVDFRFVYCGYLFFNRFKCSNFKSSTQTRQQISSWIENFRFECEPKTNN